MFHGYGADANDLSALGSEIKTNKPWNWVFPQGPLAIPLGPHWTGHAWWNIDLNRWEKANADGDYDLSNESPKELPETRKKVMKFIEDHKIPWSKIVLGGFSQGGMLAADIYMHAPEKPMGLILLSTSLINKQTWKPFLENRKGGTFYLAHGKQDTVIHVNNCQRLHSFLKQGGLEGKLEIFEGPHTIPMSVIRSVGQYLNERS